MKRAITLSIAVALSIGIAVPLTTNLTQASKQNSVRKNKKVRKYSRAWWRQYRAKVRRNRIFAKRRREMAAVRDNNRGVKTIAVVNERANSLKTPVNGWSGESATPNGDAKYSVKDQNGNQIGSAQLSIVGVAAPQSENQMVPAKMRDKMLGGVATSNFRRAVIDRVIRENGWVTNDYSSEIAGKKVFVVVAQTPNGTSVNSRVFYFTEVDGRIYNLSTNVSNDNSEKTAADAEEFLRKLQRSDSSSQEVSASTDLQ